MCTTLCGQACQCKDSCRASCLANVTECNAADPDSFNEQVCKQKSGVCKVSCPIKCVAGVIPDSAHMLVSTVKAALPGLFLQAMKDFPEVMGQLMSAVPGLVAKFA